jgi:hypothetical protein
LFKLISARNADLADLEYLRQVDYAASHGLRIRLARCSELWMRSAPPGVGEPFNRPLWFAIAGQIECHEQLVRFGLVRWGLKVD